MVYEIVVTQNSKMLKNLSLFLDKAAGFADSKKVEASVLLNSRLAPDQFNLTRQIQIACDSAKLCASRLAGKDAPVHEDKEKSIPELKTRIDDVIKYLNTFSAMDFKGFEEKRITQPRWEGKSLSGFEFLTQYATPNVYFHVTTAYAILRHNGVDLGKNDYLGTIPYKK